MTFIINLFSILWKVPAAVGIIKAILDIAGSDAVKAILESIQEVVKAFQKSDTPIDDLPQTERVRIIDRLKLRLGQRLLNISNAQLAVTLAGCQRFDELRDLQNA